MSNKELSSISTGLILTQCPPNDLRIKSKLLVLVKKRESGLFTVIGGHKRNKESPSDCILRETTEEVGDAISKHIVISGRPLMTYNLVGEKDSLGFWFEGSLDLLVPSNGLKLHTDELGSLHTLNFEEVEELRKCPEQLYKPEFNQVVLNFYLFKIMYSRMWHFSDENDIDLARSYGLPETMIQMFFNMDIHTSK